MMGYTGYNYVMSLTCKRLVVCADDTDLYDRTKQMLSMVS
jgi:hypothetical protein